MNPNDRELSKIAVTNMLGQTVYGTDTMYPGSYSEYQLNNLATGTYIVQVITDDNSQFTKKFIVK